MLRCAMVGVAAILLVSCSSKESSRQSAAAETPARLGFDARPAQPSLEPVPTRTARVLTDDLFALQPAPAGRVLIRGRRISPDTDVDCRDDRLVAYRKAGRRLPEVLLMDLDSGATMATFDEVFDGSPAAGAIWGGRGKHARTSIVRYADGAIVRAQPRLPDNLRPTEVQLAVRGPSLSAPGSADVWLFARANDGTVFHGKWADLSDPNPLLDEQLPFWPTASWATDRLEVWSSEDGLPVGAKPGAGACVRFALGGGKPPTCRATGPVENAGYPTFLGEGWAFHGGEISNAEQKSSEYLDSSCHMMVQAALANPPRLLAMCFPEKTRRKFILWSPERRWTFEEPETSNIIHSRPGSTKPVFAIPHFWADSDEVPSDRWIDIERGTIVHTEPLFPIDFALSGLDRQFLATRPDSNPIEVVLVDLDAATTTTIARVDDCDGELSVYTRTARRLAMVCSKRTSPTKYVFDVRWSEIIDLDRQRRWRTPLYPERFFADRRILASDKRRIAGETFNGGTAIYWIDID